MNKNKRLEMTIPNPNKTIWHLSTWLIISLIVLNLLNFQTTLIAIEYHVYEEINPILNYLVDTTATPWAVLWFKATMLGFLFIPYFFISKYREKYQTKRMIWILEGLNIIYLLIVISNFTTITL